MDFIILHQTFITKKNWILGMGIGLGIYIQTQTQTQNPNQKPKNFWVKRLP